MGKKIKTTKKQDKYLRSMKTDYKSGKKQNHLLH